MLIGHLSDLHVLDLSHVRPWQFLNKRVAGGLNLLLGRAKHHQSGNVSEALAMLRRLGAEHIVVSGDLSNLSFASEFHRVRELLLTHFRPEQLTVVPGNHDRYTLASLLRGNFERALPDLVGSDLPHLTAGATWPRVRLLDGVAIVALDTASHQPPVFSGGRVGVRQARALEAVLAHPELTQRFRIVVLHHHLRKPDYKRSDLGRGLTDATRLRRVLLRGAVDLVLHGHNHGYTFEPLEGSAGRTWVSEAGSTTVKAHEQERFRGKFNLYRVEQRRLVELTTYAYQENGGFAAWRRWVPGDSAPRPLPNASEGHPSSQDATSKTPLEGSVSEPAGSSIASEHAR